MTIGQRLKEERLRLKMNQPDFAALGGKVKKTLIDYEKDESSPDAKFLAAIAAAGADTNYILTGQRAHLISEENPGYTLRPDQKALLDNLENCSKEDQDAIRRMALRCAGDRTDEPEEQKKNHTI
ncbi:MAG: helix-turn-helix domain-containing protein [Methylomicrobium sp.]